MNATEPSPAAYRRAGQLVLQELERIAKEDAEHASRGVAA